jgi:hypothetical protein
MTTTIGGSYPAVNSDSDATINGLTVGKGGGAVASATAVGNNAMLATNTGANNSAFGSSALRSNTSGADNTSVGLNSMYYSTTGNTNIAMGVSVLQNNTTGSSNVGLGYQALLSNTTASNNTAVGYQAGYTANGACPENTVIGYQAGYAMTNLGGYNTFVGVSAGVAVTTGQENQFFGRFSGSAITTGSKNTIIGKYSGNQGGLDIRTASNWVVLSDGDGNPYFSIDNTPQVYLKQSGNTTQWKALKESYMGYSNSYGALVLGATNQNQTVCIGIDPATITGGNFNGSGDEILVRRSARFIVPNSGATDFENMLLWSGQAITIPGSLSKGSGSFRIDHPLPELEKTHQLVHSFIEGPQADLIYRGVVALVNGKATVNIDIASDMTEGTFEVLCRDVQCFTTNESDWILVRGKVDGNILTIEAQDETATSSISWMVIGERKDKHMIDTEWTDDNGKVIVEPLKPIIETASEKGK